MAKRTPKTGGVMTEDQMVAALLKDFPRAEYAFLQQVRNATGFSRVTRTADAIALSLWPSRGLVLHGFEFKRYRGDWKREKDNPAKAEEIARFCDFWWVVVTDVRIVDIDELPPTWGLKAPNADGTALVTLQTATKMDPEPWSRGFMAAILRNVSDGSMPIAAHAAKVEQARAEGFERGKGTAPASEAETELRRLRTLETRVAEFSRASGISLDVAWRNGRELGEAVDIVLRQRQVHQQFVQAVAGTAKHLPSLVTRVLDDVLRSARVAEQQLTASVNQLEALAPALDAAAQDDIDGGLR
jgi:hypothetical protein